MSSKEASATIADFIEHISVGPCVCSQTTAALNKSICRLEAQQFREFLEELGQRRNGEREKAIFDYRVRQHLGIWYGTTALVAASSKKNDVFSMDEQLGALARECLQWHESAFLSHVLVYYRAPVNEEIELFTAVTEPVPSDGKLSKCLDEFLEALQVYTTEYGSTVRGDYHQIPYQLSALHDLESPVSPPKDPVSKYSTLHMPSDRNPEGPKTEDAYLECVKKHFAHRYPVEGSYQIQHFAAGGEVQYPTGKIGAVAHMYVVSTEELEPSTQYRHTMHAVLQQIAMVYALKKVQKTVEKITDLAESQQTLNEQLRNRFRPLSDHLLTVNAGMVSVRRLLYKNNWHAIQDLLFDLRLVVTDGAKIPLSAMSLVGRHSDLTPNHWASVFLILTAIPLPAESTTQASLPSAATPEGKSKTPAEIWREISEKGFPEEAFTNDAILRCLGRMDLLKYERPEWLSEGILKEGLLDPFGKNGTSLLMLMFCMGVSAIDIDSLEIDKRFELEGAVQIECVANGLNLLLESLLRFNRRRPDHPFANRQLYEPISLAFDLQPSELIIDLSPVTVNGTQVSLADDGFQQVLRQVSAKIASEMYPGRYSNETTMLTLYALGLDEERWGGLRSYVEVDPNASQIAVKDGSTESSAVIFRDGKLSMRYRIKSY